MKTDRCKHPGEFRFISFGDVHLGHPQTPTKHILNNLVRYVTPELIREVDMVIITGDLFDHLLTAADDNLYLIHNWMSMLMYKCAAYNTSLVVVEGTPLHDRLQSRYFVEQKENAQIPVDLHYAQTLSIVYFEKFDANFLFVPDKCRNHTSEILQDVRLLMQDRGLTKVDYAVMHGAFEYQLPDVVTEPTHDSATYLELVDRYILIGHVHIATQLERILAAGDFDRLTHGEEHAKGLYHVVARDSRKDSITFIENERAKRYDTLDCRGMETKELNVLIRKKLATLPKGSSIRLRCNPHDAATGDMAFLNNEFPQYVWELLVENKTKKKENVVDTLAAFDLSQFLDITRQSMLGLLEPELLKHAKGNEVIAKRCRDLMEDLIGA